MTRRDAIYAISLLSAMPLNVFALSDTELELLGLKKPELFGNNYNLRKEAALAFDNLRKAALKDKIQLYSVSSYRSFDRQKGIFERKFINYKNQGLSGPKAIQKIIQYSTIPGTSRHHWGTDLDLIDLSVPKPNSVLLEKHFTEGGVYHNMYQWLIKYASDFGFYETYTNEISRKGFKYEPWHYSYAPLSIKLIQDYQKIDALNVIKSKKINGIEFVTESVWQKYFNENIMDINPVLLNTQ